MDLRKVTHRALRAMLALSLLLIATLSMRLARPAFSQGDQDETPTATPSATPTYTLTPRVTITPSRTPAATRMPPPPGLFFPFLLYETGWIGPAVVESDCARIDRRPGRDEFAVCASGNACRIVDNDKHCGACSVTITAPTEVCTWGPETLLLVLDPDPSFMNPSATRVVVQANAAGRFIVSTHLVKNRTVYTATVVRICGRVVTTRIVGQFGLCDPSGSIRVITRIGSPAQNVDGATVTLMQLTDPWDGETATSPTHHVAGHCYNRLTKPVSAAAPSTAGNPAAPYWNTWSGLATPTPPAGGALATGPFGTGEANPSTSGSTGAYGWMVAPDGCYYVEVDPSTATSPGYASMLPAAVSPIVASFASSNPGHAVGDLDLTYYFNPQAGPGTAIVSWASTRRSGFSRVESVLRISRSSQPLAPLEIRNSWGLQFAPD